jgi:quercetin dioxygenase-like cupin family protein
VEIRRFGPGHRRREALPGTKGVSGQGIHTDVRGSIAELAFAPHASIAAHTNPNTTYFVVIEGGGFVEVGDEESRVAAGEAIVWPPNVPHAARTDLTAMRALVVEFAGSPSDARLLLDGQAELIDATSERSDGPEVQRGEGGLAPKPPVSEAAHVSPEQEPW